MDQIQHEFVAETEDLIEQIFVDIDELRDKYDQGWLRRKLVDRLFRQVHSLKGSTATIGLERLSEIAHEFERLLDAIRAGRVRLNDSVLDTLEAATNSLSESLSAGASGKVEQFPKELFERIRMLAGDTLPASTKLESVLNELPSEVWLSLGEDERRHLAEAVQEAAHLFAVVSGFDIADFDEQFYRLREKLAEQGEVISTVPSVDNQQPDKINFRILYATQSNLQEVEDFTRMFPNLDLVEIAKSTKDYEFSRDEEGDSRVAVEQVASASSLSRFIRLDLNALDRLISSTHDLFLKTDNAFEFVLANLSAAADQKDVKPMAADIRQSFMAVEDEIISLRMILVSRVLQRAVRAGRAAARLAKKEIDFEIVGMDLRLDKLLCDAIGYPLIHLVRNAVDHGIESGEQRLKAGKKERGTVRIEAITEGSKTRIRVTDDGRGIDPELVSRAAEELGIINPDLNFDMDRSLRLIFRAGFSTASNVTSVSGRGVGLDVVESAVEQAGGEIRVSSEPGRGSLFEISLPVTFGLLRSTVIIAAGNRYCIDASQLQSTQTVDANQIEERDGARVLRCEGAILPLVSMSKLLGKSSEETDSRRQFKIITCQFSDQTSSEGWQDSKPIGLVVDGIEGTEQVLVRSLGRHAGRWHGVDGAAELHDGTVALVLDLPRLLSGIDSGL